MSKRSAKKRREVTGRFSARIDPGGPGGRHILVIDFITPDGGVQVTLDGLGIGGGWNTTAEAMGLIAPVMEKAKAELCRLGLPSFVQKLTKPGRKSSR